MRKNIEVSTYNKDYIIEALKLRNTDIMLNIAEDLSDAVNVLSEVEDCPAGVISSVSAVQKLILELIRLEED